MSTEQADYQKESSIGTQRGGGRAEAGPYEGHCIVGRGGGRAEAGPYEGHCITCSDEAVPVKVVHLDVASGLAMVMREDEPDIQEEIDITLLDTISPGDMVLAHGGVAIAHLKASGNE